MAKLVSEGTPRKNTSEKRFNDKSERKPPHTSTLTYPMKNGKPLISKELIEYLLKTQKSKEPK
jgi:ribosome biogenesis SPOUT family RNA methylase Rps3